MTKVEEVGKAVLADLTDRKGFRHLIDNLDDEVLNDIRQCVGRAAIKALRTPSVEMMRAYAEAVNSPVHGEYLDTPIAYRVMITAALGETDE